jgi:hypothetical protein
MPPTNGNLVAYDPYAPAADLVPWGAWPVEPTGAEEAVWRAAQAQCYREMNLGQSVRVIWFAGGDEPELRGQALRTRPPVVLLRAGRRLEDLRKTCLHELRHVYQAQFAEGAWDSETCEVDARAFATRMMRGRR